MILNTVTGGISIENITEVEPDKKIYAALTGDQCVIENIRMKNV